MFSVLAAKLLPFSAVFFFLSSSDFDLFSFLLTLLSSPPMEWLLFSPPDLGEELFDEEYWRLRSSGLNLAASNLTSEVDLRPFLFFLLKEDEEELDEESLFGTTEDVVAAVAAVGAEFDPMLEEEDLFGLDEADEEAIVVVCGGVVDDRADGVGS